MTNDLARRGPVAGLVLLAAVVATAGAADPQAKRDDPAVLIEAAARSGERTWQRVQQLHESLASRDIFTCALAWCEAGVHAERIPTLLATAARMQDRDKNSRGYGNFRWSWRDGSVRDYNAVEFCMQGGSLLWMRHRQKLPEATRKALQETLAFAIQGCLRHRVPVSYTNIAIMNAGNLILLGEAMDKADVAEEGYQRLREFLLYTWENGIHEYCSPTYYGVDLDCLMLIEQFCRRPTGKARARALLELFWTDIAANWYEANGRLAGARSRDYDYLRGRGYLTTMLAVTGWLDRSGGSGMAGVWPALCRWRPPARLREMSGTRFPRLVRQRWGAAMSSFRTHYLCKDVTLSCSGANYGAMDLPLTVDLPGAPTSLRCYYIPDARRDPYGKKKIPAGSHFKTLHLRSFWAGTQRRTDALGVCVHRASDVQAGPATLESHFVMPLDVDAIYVAGKKVMLDPDTPVAHPFPAGQAVVIRKGSAAVGVRLPWTRGLDGQVAAAALVWDGNPHRAIRLTVAHHNFWGVVAPKAFPGAAFWVRVGSSLAGDAAFDKWHAEFAAAKAQAEAGKLEVAINVAGTDGPLALKVAPAYSGLLAAQPAPGRCILEIDGKDVGREILKDLPAVKAYKKAVTDAPVLAVSATRGTYLEAESGAVVGGMRIGKDLTATGGKYVWAPGEPGERGRVSGMVTWRLGVAKTGKYWLWGRVLAPTSSDDSFFLRIHSESAEPLGLSDWHTGTHAEWEWTRIRLDRSETLRPIVLPKGELRLELRPREDGTKIDALFLTPNAEQVPQ